MACWGAAGVGQVGLGGAHLQRKQYYSQSVLEDGVERLCVLTRRARVRVCGVTEVSHKKKTNSDHTYTCLVPFSVIMDLN